MNVLEQCLQERRSRLQASLAERQVDGLLVSDTLLLNWLGQRSKQLLLVTGAGIEMLEPDRAVHTLRGIRRIGFDPALTAPRLLALQERAPHLQWIFFGRELARVRSIKDRIELTFLCE